jgi:hypothetical protein
MASRLSWALLPLVMNVTWIAAAESLSATAASSSVPSPVRDNSMMAASPMTDYTVSVVIYVLMIGVLVAGLLIGGLLILNLGLMSKRESDHTGGRTPSDVGILKSSNWPQEVEEASVLPAAEEDVNADEREQQQMLEQVQGKVARLPDKSA